jgi:hypothetical protein
MSALVGPRAITRSGLSLSFGRSNATSGFPSTASTGTGPYRSPSASHSDSPTRTAITGE